ncbi:hypothetical protein [Mangrovicoccus ximenensis]|uniref:hypothetical protein n=1 Tax=Mangrovicoccus ximenensis TaxID=1911570 RepID=UPI000D3AAAAF|nr:hypothetical protein [Mangrovicoccus ximenensis]
MRQRQWIALDTGSPVPRGWKMTEERAAGPACEVAAADLSALAGEGGLAVACGPLADQAASPKFSHSSAIGPSEHCECL